jgi:hypothetical protein
MAGPSWITGTLAAVMVLTAAYSASRLAASRRRGLATEADTDRLHVFMGTAMAGMLMPQLTLLPGRAWALVFGAGAAWFGACALRSRTLATVSWRCRYPVPHLIECIAMLYMLLAVPAAQDGAGTAMPGMGVSPGAPAAFPALAVVLALFLLGYVLWTGDQLTSLARARATMAAPARIPEHRALVTVPAAPRAAGLASTAGTPDAIAAPGQESASSRVQLAPGLAAVSKIAMSITMGYMLLLMLWH